MEGSIDEPVSGELPALRLRLLNDFCLVCDEGPVTGLTSARGQSLLAYLALHRQAPQRRQQLAFLFWPDATEAQARNNLRQLMHQLRRAWPATDRYLAADASALSWRHDVHLWIDVAEFESTVALADEAERRADVVTMRAALERAVGLYQGDLLPGCYEDWIVPERQRLGQRYSRTLDRLIALLEGQRAYGAAIEYADERLRHDPLEDAYRQLMRLHALNHDRAGGLRVYQACATWLERELAIEPSLATRQVYERLQRLEALEEMAPAAALEVTLPLVGRQREWTQVQGAWRRAADGQPHLLLIGGEPGIGKSRLAEELLSWANQQGITTARTRVYAAEGRLSYAPAADWLRSEALRPALAGLDPVWRGEVARLLPELLSEPLHVQSPTRLGEHGQRQHFFQALARAVLSADQPLLLVLDDLQWCDQDTLEWLHYLLRFDRQARLLVAGTARTEEVQDRHPLATLTPLDAAETAQLAAQVIGRALEVLTHAHDGGEDGLVRGLDELWRRGIVREQGASAYDFAHDKIREIAYSQVTAARRRILHRRVAQALEHVYASDLDAVSSQVTTHYEHAGLPDQAVAAYQRAAEVAQRVYATQEAIRLLQRGLMLLVSLRPSQERDTRELALRTALGAALVATRGYGAPEVMAVYQRARDLCRHLGQPPSPPVLRALAIASLTNTEFRQAHELGDHLLSLAEHKHDPVLLVEARYVLGMSSFWTGAIAPTREHLQQALVHYRTAQSAAHVPLYTQDPGVVCLTRLGMDLWLLGYPEQAAQKRAAGLALARDLRHPFSLGYALIWDAVLQNHRQDARATRAAAEAAIAVSREHRLDLWLAIGTVLRGWAIAEQGEVKTGIAVMHEGMVAFRATGSRFMRPYFLGLLAEQWAKLGDVERGLTLLAEALATIQRTGECWCEAELHRRQGDLSQLRDGDRNSDGNDAAEVAFQRALAVAKHQAAKTLELRAVASLARLWQRQGKHAEAQRLLEQNLGWFVEGLDSPEVIAARSLLAQLR